MRTPRFAALALALAASLPVRAQQGEKTASQTVVMPGLPGMKNEEIQIAGQDIAGAEMTGPVIEYAARVVQWEEGRSVTVRLEDGTSRVVPVVSTVIFPPDLRPGAMVLFFIRQTSDGRYRVIGMRTGGDPAPGPAARASAPEPAAPQEPPAPPSPPGVSTPPATSQPGPPPPRGKTVIGATFLTVKGTVKAFEPGRSITVTESGGRERTLPLADGASVPEKIAAGDAVTIRVPLQKPFDGKTADRIERQKAKKAPPPSKFQDAQTPKG